MDSSTIASKKDSPLPEVMPNFLYIGAEKAGSTWIYEILREHPEVFVPPAKDTQFFHRQYEKGMDWYLSFFQDANGKKAIGEVDHDLFLDAECAERIQKMLPDARLICCLREPVERTISSYLYYKLIFLNDATTFESFAFSERVLKLSDYYFNLAPFYERFPRENILVLFFDDLQTDPFKFAQSIYHFLGVDADFCPKVLREKMMPASEPRITWLAHLAFTVGLLFRKIGKPNVVGKTKNNAIFNKILYKKMKQKPDMPEDVQKRLKEYYRERYQSLSELIGQPIPKKWSI